VKVPRGLLPCQVLQRDTHGRGTADFGGDATAEGEVWVRVREGARDLEGHGWKKAGVAHDGSWEARVANLPTGGPYRVEAEIRQETHKLAGVSVSEILVGDLWVLAGQSNMEGVGVLRDVEPPHPLVRSFEMSRVWKHAEEPLHWLLESPDPVHWWGMTGEQRDEFIPTYRRDRDRGAGLGLPFAKHLVAATEVPVGLLPVAHGGTNMEQWDPGKGDQGGNSLYGSMLRHVKAAGGRVAGILWFQGETEGFEQEPSPFLDRFLALVTAMRHDFDAPELPFLYVQIGRVVMPEVPANRWTEIRELQRLALEKIPHAAMVASVDLPLEDPIHLATPAHKLLGIRLAKQALRLTGKDRKMKPGPMFKRADTEGEKRDRVRVWFEEFNGDLLPERLVRGFSVRDADQKDLALVFEAMPDPRQPGSVLVLLRAPVPEGSSLWYGWGPDPVCTLADSEGMAAPAFGPVKL